MKSIEEMLSEGVEGAEVVQPTDEKVQVPYSVLSDGEPFFKSKMLETIDQVNQYSWARGEIGGLDWGFTNLNEAFEGLNTGVHLVGGQSNAGKSGFCMQIALGVAKANRVPTKKNPRKAFVLYFSLDDSNNELLPRCVAIDQKIPINTVRFPKKHQDDIVMMEKREVGLENIKDLAMHLHMIDVNEGSSIEHIEETAEKFDIELKKIDEAYQLVLIIDNFHDITVDAPHIKTKESSVRYDYVADQLSRIATRFDCPIICTAEFRKLNGNRRPGLDDIRETTKIVYEAKAIILCYNEVGLRGQQASVFWNKPDSPDKQPVFEADIRKNKFGSFKGKTFFEFYPEMSFFKEVPKAGALRYSQMISG